jgi:hypothetical protein
MTDFHSTLSIKEGHVLTVREYNGGEGFHILSMNHEGCEDWDFEISKDFNERTSQTYLSIIIEAHAFRAFAEVPLLFRGLAACETVKDVRQLLDRLGVRWL